MPSQHGQLQACPGPDCEEVFAYWRDRQLWSLADERRGIDPDETTDQCPACGAMLTAPLTADVAQLS